MGGLFLIAIGVLIVVGVIWEFNKFIELNNKVKKSKSIIDSYLTQRFNLVPNLIQCTKDFLQHEAETFAKMSILRIKYDKEKDLEIGKELASYFNRIMIMGEDYPELKVKNHFLFLQESLVKNDAQLQEATKVYNEDVASFNTTISAFPEKIVATIFGFKEKDLFEVKEYKTENVSTELQK